MLMQRKFHFHQVGFHAAHGAAAAFCALFSSITSVICMGVADAAASIFVFCLLAVLGCVGIGVVAAILLGSRSWAGKARSCSFYAPSDVSV